MTKRMDQSRPRGSGSTGAAFAAGFAVAVVTWLLVYFVGIGRSPSTGGVLLSTFVAVAVGVTAGWRVHRRGWRTLGTGD